MIYRATLKKPWISPRGRLYPPGTIFIFSRRLRDINSTIYNFVAPGQGFGFVVLPDIIFKQPTEEEKYIRVLRDKLREEHIKKTTELFNI
jgi:hypothetical protein